MTRAAHEEFGLSVALDKEYHRAMNILTPAGFATLSSVNLFLLRNFFEYTTFDLRALLHDYEDPFGQCPSLLWRGLHLLDGGALRNLGSNL